MSGENIVVLGTQKSLETNGAQIASNAFVKATNSYSVATDGANFPDGQLVLTGTLGGAPANPAIFSLYARPLDIDGTLDADVPNTFVPQMLVGNFYFGQHTNPQSALLYGGFARDLPLLAEYYILNNYTGQALNAGWALKIIPRTFKVA